MSIACRDESRFSVLLVKTETYPIWSRIHNGHISCSKAAFAYRSYERHLLGYFKSSAVCLRFK